MAGSPQAIFTKDQKTGGEYHVEYDCTRKRLNIMKATKKVFQTHFGKVIEQFSYVLGGGRIRQKEGLGVELEEKDLKKIIKNGLKNPSTSLRVFDVKGHILQASYDPTTFSIHFEDITDKQIMTHYQEALRQFREEGGELVRIKDGFKCGLTPDLLKKAIEIALSKDPSLAVALEDSSRGRLFNVWYDSQTHEVEVGAVGAFIAQGSAGKVLHYDNFSSFALPSHEVIKHVRKKLGVKAIEDLKNENAKLKRIHKEGLVYGVQAQARRMGRMAMKGMKHPNQTKFKLAYVTREYTYSYKKEIEIRQKNKTPPSLEVYLKEIHQLMAGFAFLVEHDYLCGDLKPGNVLVGKDSNGTRQVVLSDLGSVRHVSDAKSLAELAGNRRLATRLYSPREELEKSEKLARDIEKLEDKLLSSRDEDEIDLCNKALEQKMQELIQLEQKRDVFSMGCTLYEGLTTTTPYAVMSGHINMKKYLGLPPRGIDDSFKTFTASIPEAIQGVIERMINSDPDKRPTALEAFKTIDGYIKVRYRALHAQILKDVKANYPGSVGLFNS